MNLWWYIARAGGIVALVLAAAAVLTGLVFAAKAVRGRPSPKWQLDMHRFLGGSSVAFTAIHIIGLVAASSVHFGPAAILVPFASAWNPVAVAWGVVGMYLLVAVELSSLAMKRIPRKWWRLIHMGSFGVLFTGLIHGSMAGTDATAPLYMMAMGLIIAGTMALTVYRILTSRMAKRMAPGDRAGRLAPVST